MSEQSPFSESSTASSIFVDQSDSMTRKLSRDHVQSVNRDQCLIPSILRVEMRRIMIVTVHLIRTP